MTHLISVDFADRPDNRRLPAVIIAVAIAASSGSMARLWFASKNLDRLLQTEASLQESAMDLGKKVSALSVPPPPLPKERVLAFNAVVERLNTPWPQILSLLEKARPMPVSILSVDASVESGLLTITAEGEDMESLVQYANQISRSEGIKSIVPLEQARRVTGSLPQFRFQIDFASRRR